MLTLPAVEEPAGLNRFPVLYWNHVGLEMNRITHSLGGPQTGPTMSSRALGLLHLAMQDAFLAMMGSNASSSPPTYLSDADRPVLPPGGPFGLAKANVALTAAAITVLDRLYVGTATGVSSATSATLEGALTRMIADYPRPITTLVPEHLFGKDVAEVVLARLAVKTGEIGAQQGRYEPRQGPFYFRDEPVNPVRRVPIDANHPELGTRAVRIYHGPFYGTTVADFAVTDPAGHTNAPPPTPAGPVDPLFPDYVAAAEEVVGLGGAPGLATTDRTADQTVAALYWAYDGANLIGTPPRLYNQILRLLASDRIVDDPAATDAGRTKDMVRLLALANVAMADAGKHCWKEKYRYEYWRPLSGIREHHTIGGPATGQPAVVPPADPFWFVLGAPETNTNGRPFKPPFPAYPSGHATFGAACFQIARLFFKQRDSLGFADNAVDGIAFSFVSEELNGVSRDLHQDYDPNVPIVDQPGVVRTRVLRHFPSLWAAIHENALSRIYLGVHWIFDAAAPADVHDAAGGLVPDPADVSYSDVWAGPRAAADPRPTGGVPLGLGIAADIWANDMQAPPAPAPASFDVQRANTSIR